MRELTTEEKQTEKSQKTTRMFALVILGMMVISSIGYAFLSNDNLGNNLGTGSQTEGGVTQEGNIWALALNGTEIDFTTSPQQAANVSNNMLFNYADYAGQVVYIDSPDLGVYNELESKVGLFAARVQQACYGNCSYNFPQENCSSYLIVWRNSSQDSVSQVGNCVFINGSMNAVNSFSYKLYGVN